VQAKKAPLRRLPKELSDEVIRDLSAKCDAAMRGKTAGELIASWPKLPAADMDELPPDLRRRYRAFIRLVAFKTFRN